MNYSELQQAIKDWLHREDLSSVIPTFITLAETRIENDLIPTRVLETEQVGSGTSPITIPSDFRKARHLYVQEYEDERELIYSRMAGTDTGEPESYEVVDSEIRLYPVPTTSLDYRLIYIKKLDHLKDDADYWLADEYPSLYLYASLLESAPYIGDDTRVSLWHAAYNEALRAIKRVYWDNNMGALEIS